MKSINIRKVLKKKIENYLLDKYVRSVKYTKNIQLLTFDRKFT